ncbi:MAG: tRNA (adenosine(37)-N6)-dimethylallyltransferase MiaA [Nocardioidaceae bacterium]|nr:tRNA (adenosine(37)-N6)-dimethylallyltransferase MiaA [Nocardioidaceae bacterium]
MPRVLAIVGPTAAGKSALAVAMAEHLGGEVVSVDSMQVYRGMDIGTAKLPLAQRRGVPHHLLDLVDVTAPATVAEFQSWARVAIAGCHHRGTVPVLVGGSALYIRAVLDRFDFPGTDEGLRERLEADLASVGATALHRRLAAADPQSAARILPTNGRRIVRALEVVTLTGRPFTAALPPYEYAFPDVVQLGIDVPRDALDERIASRVDAMWTAGLIDEVRRLEAVGLRRGRTACRALGYAQVLRHLAGECSAEQAKADTVRATTRFARRQDSWFRKDPRITWLPYDASDLFERALGLVRR